MITVRPFEAEILRILHAVFGRSPVEPVLKTIFSSRPRPKCLSPKALLLIEGTLAKGVVHRLARRDGWRRERFIQGDRVISGRLWERTSLDRLKLGFSKESLAILIHLVTSDPSTWSTNPWLVEGPVTLGDSLFLFLILEAFRDTKLAPLLVRLPPYQGNMLCRLAFPHDYAEIPELEPATFEDWVEPERVWLIETLQSWLADRWIAAEFRKRTLKDPAQLVKLGQEQMRVIDAYLDALDSSVRPDLARFLLRSARELLRDGKGLETWNGSLQLQALNFAGRAEVNRAALAILAPMERFQSWEHKARDIGFLDDGYAAAQLWKSDWETIGGDELCQRSRSLFRSADPLASSH